MERTSRRVYAVVCDDGHLSTCLVANICEWEKQAKDESTEGQLCDPLLQRSTMHIRLSSSPSASLVPQAEVTCNPYLFSSVRTEQANNFELSAQCMRPLRQLGKWTDGTP